eukprot:GFUD01115855.1.p1 GENE.GFUD01115855.1~~GFUD01115855.1.p1  ORF type:complete len:606 (+),score=169.37 GFUD01115855.1:62-1819(+)
MSGDSDSDDCDMPGLVSNGTDGVPAPGGAGAALDEEEDLGEEMYVDSLAPSVDLFSAKKFKTAEDCLEHCKEVHGLDLAVLKRRLSMDTFSYIRFVNYVRSESPSPGFVMSLSSGAKWGDLKFMKPVIPDDPLLMFNFEEELDPQDEEEENGFEIDISRELNDEIANPRNFHNQLSTASTNSEDSCIASNVTFEEDLVKMSLDKFNDLKKQFDAMSLELREKDNELKAVFEDMTKMKGVAQTLFNSGGEAEKPFSKTKHKVVPVSEARTVEEDHSYFQSYAHYSIHHEMLSDSVRTSSYRDALVKNPERLRDALVLDIGCGTGILSMFAAEAGAKAVVGVDCSDIIYQAMDIVRENKMDDRVKLVKGRLEETELPYDKFDIIVSEWMGYFLLFEGMLDSVLAARDKYLAPGGMVLPNRCTIELCAISDHERYDSLVGFWSDVYGYKMSCMRGPILADASVEVIPKDLVVSNSANVLDLNINTCTVADTEFSSNFDLKITKDCELTGILGYFDTFFDLPVPAMFSTGPQVKPTHWKQTVFYLPEKLPVKKNETIPCKMVCKRMKTDARALKVSLTLDDKTYRYTVD